MCRSRRELSNAYLLAKIGVDTAENEPLEVWGRNSIQYSLHSLVKPVHAQLLEVVGVADHVPELVLEEADDALVLVPLDREDPPRVVEVHDPLALVDGEREEATPVQVRLGMSKFDN